MRVDDYINRLPHRRKDAVYRRFFYQQTYPVAARKMGLSVAMLRMETGGAVS